MEQMLICLSLALIAGLLMSRAAKAVRLPAVTAYLLTGRFPGPRVFWGGWLIAFVMLVLGVLMFKRKQDDFILYI